MSNHECPNSIELTPDPNDFDNLIGQEFDFYGVDNNCFKLDDRVYEAVEDESDGYRSCLGCVETREAQGKIFFTMPVARIVIESVDETIDYNWSSAMPFQGYRLIDLHDGHEWLKFGTGDHDDYYPMFIFEYSPKAVTSPLVTERPPTPLLNRAQRRTLQRYIARKTRAQMTVVKRRKPWLADEAKMRCRDCSLLYLGSTSNRCQCQVRMAHRCMMCGAVFMASQQEYRDLTSVCPMCADVLQVQWDNEEASRAAAYERYEEIGEAEMDVLIDEVAEECDETLRALADL